jgi:hypothetical protein
MKCNLPLSYSFRKINSNIHTFLKIDTQTYVYWIFSARIKLKNTSLNYGHPTVGYHT